ncbi:MAG: hypothetical protein Q9227_003512 [Pyrenula ochraceoflavens]
MDTKGHSRNPSYRVSNVTSSTHSDDQPPLSPSGAVSATSAPTSQPETIVDRDLSSLLDPQNYSPIPQDDIPEPFHTQLPALPALESFSVSRQRLDDLLRRGEFLGAAHLTGAILTSQGVSPSDYFTIFDLLCIRFSCLELTGNTYIAAQESRIVGDTSNPFWYVGADTSVVDQDPEEYRYSTHMMPFHFRLQVTRLQSLAFTDGRRGISALYELGLECREHAMSATDLVEKQLWKERLGHVGIQVVNTLVEMGELDTARRTLLSSFSAEGSETNAETVVRLTLLLLRIGDIGSARNLLEKLPSIDSSAGLLQALLYVADGKYEEAVSEWKSLLDKSKDSEQSFLIKQNLAVCMLYTGNLQEAKATLEDLVHAGGDFQSLTFNLSTLYELSSDKAKMLKEQLAERVAQHGPSSLTRGKTNADFKL